MTTEALLRMLSGARSADDRFFGVVAGVVTDNRDPDGMHRVKVRLPWLSDDAESHWARVATPMAGPGRGLYLLPEVDDEVLLAFEHGSLEHPFVIGSLWNGQDQAHENNSDGRNDNRSFKSRSGHVVRLCDSDGDERVEIIDKTGSNRIVIHSSDNSLSIEAQGDISIHSSTGKVKIEGVGVEITSDLDVKIDAKTTVDASANAEFSIRGAMVKINS